jgi:subtilisin family serine protease
MKLLLLFVITLCTISFGQTKYFIYFKDKGPGSGESLNKSDIYYIDAIKTLTTAAIERREKTLGEDFVDYDDIPVNENYIKTIEDQGIKIVNKLSWFNSVSAYLASEQRNTIIALPFVKEITQVRTLKFKSEKLKSSDALNKTTIAVPDYGISYSQLQMEDIPAVHAAGITGQGVLIGLLDTGFDWREHESLKNKNVVGEYDFINHDSVTAQQPGDPIVDGERQDAHGTLVFSVVGGYKDSTFIGASFNSSFLLAKTENIASESHIEEDNYAAALIWMENQGVQITSSSLGYNIFDDTTYSYTYQQMDGNTTIVAKACKLAFHKGVVTITAAGNEGDQPWMYIDTPADEDSIIAVGAVDGQNSVASFSSLGPTADGRLKPEVVALGVGVWGAVSGTVSDYVPESGTSLSTPIVCGVAGLLLSASPYLTNRQVRDIFLETSDNTAFPNNSRGYGLISAVKAVSFPNIHFISSSSLYMLNKIYIDKNVVSSSVHINYTVANNKPVDTTMTFDGTFRFNYTFPSFPSNEEVDFYFTYLDSQGHTYRDPANAGVHYKYLSGSLNVALNLSLNSPLDYGILSQNYPNPFNSSTTIRFKSVGNQSGELDIFNILGERVRTIYIPNSIAGENSIQWNGKGNFGNTLPSGIYVYSLNLAGSFYTKKMVYLK